MKIVNIDQNAQPNFLKKSLSLIGLAVSAALLFTAGGLGQTSSKPTPEPFVITVAAVGDIMLASPYPNDTRMPPNDGADLLKEVTPILSAADIAFGNLEGPMADSGTSTKCKLPEPPKELKPGEKPEPVRCYAFHESTRYGKHLKAAGFFT